MHTGVYMDLSVYMYFKKKKNCVQIYIVSAYAKKICDYFWKIASHFLL